MLLLVTVFLSVCAALSTSLLLMWSSSLRWYLVTWPQRWSSSAPQTLSSTSSCLECPVTGTATTNLNGPEQSSDPGTLTFFSHANKFILKHCRNLSPTYKTNLNCIPSQGYEGVFGLRLWGGVHWCWKSPTGPTGGSWVLYPDRCVLPARGERLLQDVARQRCRGFVSIYIGKYISILVQMKKLIISVVQTKSISVSIVAFVFSLAFPELLLLELCTINIISYCSWSFWFMWSSIHTAIW